MIVSFVFVFFFAVPHNLLRTIFLAANFADFRGFFGSIRVN